MRHVASIILLLGSFCWGLMSDINPQAVVVQSSLLSDLARMQAEIDALKASTSVAVPSVAASPCDSVARSEFPMVRLTGFFQTDAVYFSQDDANLASVGDV